MATRGLSELLREQPLVRGSMLATMLAIALLAGANWLLSPEQGGRWLGKMLLLPALYLVLALWYAWLCRARPALRRGDEPAVARYLRATLLLGTAAIGIRQITLLGLELWVRLGDRGDLEIERRILGLSTAAVLVVLGNLLPKILTPLSILPLHLAERVTRARRFVGTLWVILGLTIATAFIALPLAAAKLLARGAGLAAVAVVLCAIVWMNLGPAQRDEP